MDNFSATLTVLILFLTNGMLIAKKGFLETYIYILIKRKKIFEKGEFMEKAKHKTEIRVIYADTDAMAVVYHSNYFKWFEVGRGELLRNMGYPYSRLEQEGIMLPVIECGCKYIKPAVYDDLLEINTIVKEIKTATVIMEYEIYRKSTGERLVTGFTKHAVTNSSLKPVRLRSVAPDLYQLFLNKSG